MPRVIIDVPADIAHALGDIPSELVTKALREAAFTYAVRSGIVDPIDAGHEIAGLLHELNAQ